MNLLKNYSTQVVKVKYIFCVILFTAISFVTACAEESKPPSTQFVEGQHFHRLSPTVATDVEEGQVEVVELFWYGCPHCYEFEKYLKVWKPNKAENILFTPMPAVLNRSWVPHARAYYALETMGEIERVHPIIFEAIHAQGRRLRDVESMSRFLSQHGVDAEEFKKAYDSFYVETKIKRADQLSRQYGATSVPAVIVNGKYRTNASSAGGYEKVLELIEILAKQEAN